MVLNPFWVGMELAGVKSPMSLANYTRLTGDELARKHLTFLLGLSEGPFALNLG